MAVTIVPIVLIPQIALAGMIVPLKGLGKVLAQWGITSYWGYHGLATQLPDDQVRQLEYDTWSPAPAFAVLALHLLVFAAATLLILYRHDPRAKPRDFKWVDRWLGGAETALRKLFGMDAR